MDNFDKILEIMSERNISQKQLADKLGVGAQKVSDWKSGKIKSYRKYLPEIAEILNVDMNELMGKENKNPATENGDGIMASYFNKQLLEIGIDVRTLSDCDVQKIISLVKIAFDK